MVDQRAHGGRQAASRRKDEVHDPLQAAPRGQHAHELSSVQCFSAQMIRQYRYPETLNRRVAHGRHVLASQAGLHADDVLATVIRFQMPFEVVCCIVGRKHRQRGELLDACHLSVDLRAGDEVPG
jgi:hypothetical protein